MMTAGQVMSRVLVGRPRQARRRARRVVTGMFQFEPVLPHEH